MSNLERTIAEVVAALFLIWGTILYLEHRGAAACVKADAVAVQAQETANAVKAAVDTQTINNEAQTYVQAIAAAPDPTPALVCVRRVTLATVPSAQSPQPVSHAGTDSPKADSPPVGDDPGPDLAKIGQAADAQITELQDYVRKVCLAKP